MFLLNAQLLFLNDTQKKECGGNRKQQNEASNQKKSELGISHRSKDDQAEAESHELAEESKHVSEVVQPVLSECESTL